MRQTCRWLLSMPFAIGVLALVAAADPALSQAVQDKPLEELKREVQEKLSKLEAALAPSAKVELLIAAGKVHEDVKRVEKLVPPKQTVVRTVPPPVYDVEDSFERLRKNQRALTDQRIGDIIILRGNQ